MRLGRCGEQNVPTQVEYIGSVRSNRAFVWDADAKKIAAELLGGGDPIEALDGAAAERAQLIALAITCAAHEANLPKDSWRGGHEYFRSIGEARTRYLQFLTEAFGYVLADIERVVVGDLNSEDDFS